MSYSKKIKKINNNVDPKTIIMVFVAIVIILGGYILCEKLILNSNCSQESNKSSVINSFDENKIVDKKENTTYKLRLPLHTWCEVDYFNGSEVVLTIDWDSYDWFEHEKQGVEKIVINNFDKKIVDVQLSSINLSFENSLLLFLMDDGTVEYVPLYDATKNHDFKSYGKLEDIKNIIRLYTAEKSIDGGSSFVILAQDTQGNIYDLDSTLNNTGYFHK